MGPYLSFFHWKKVLNHLQKKFEKLWIFSNLRGAGGRDAEKISQDGPIFNEKKPNKKTLLQQRKVGLNDNWAFW